MRSIKKLFLIFFVIYLGILPVSPVLAQAPTIPLTPPPPPSTKTVRFIYDGDGNRVTKIAGDQVTLYSENFEKNLSSGQIIKYYPLGSKRVALKKDTNLYYIIPDHHGSVSMTTGLDGGITSTRKYYPFGQERTTNTLDSTRSYIGEIKDEETSLYFFNTRYYNPQTGTFVSADSITDPKNHRNRYAYSGGNPIVNTDPGGQCIPLCLIPIGIALVKAGAVLTGVGMAAWAGSKVAQNVVIPKVMEPGSSQYNSAMERAQVVEDVGFVAANVGAIAMTLGAFAYAGGQALSNWQLERSRTLTLYKGMNSYRSGTDILPGGLSRSPNTTTKGTTYFAGQLSSGDYNQLYVDDDWPLQPPVIKHMLGGMTAESPFSSWTPNLPTAKIYAGQRGVIVSAKFRPGEVMSGPELLERYITPESARHVLGISSGSPDEVSFLIKNWQNVYSTQEHLFTGPLSASRVRIVQ